MVKTIPGNKAITAYGLLFLLFLWLIIQSVLFYQFGIVTKGEAIKYIEEAGYWQQHHHFSQPKYLFYSFYIAIQVFFIQTGLGSYGVYIFQLALNLASLLFFFKMSRRLFNNEKSALIASTLLTICIPWQLWTTHLYTESVFTSLVIIFTYYLLKPDKTIGIYLLTVFLFLLLVLTRPTGLLFIPPVLIGYMAKRLRQKKWVSLSITALITLSIFILMLNYAMNGEGEFDFLKPFIEEHIICGVPQTINNRLVLPAEGNSVQGLMYYIIHNPVHFFRLAFQKLGAFFGLTRSYYSPMHNFALGLFFYPLYAFAVIGLFKGQKNNTRFVTYITCSICIFALSVTLSCDDWLNRFIMPVLPYVFLLATAGITMMMNYFKRKVPPGVE